MIKFGQVVGRDVALAAMDFRVVKTIVVKRTFKGGFEVFEGVSTGSKRVSNFLQRCENMNLHS